MNRQEEIQMINGHSFKEAEIAMFIFDPSVASGFQNLMIDLYNDVSIDDDKSGKEARAVICYALAARILVSELNNETGKDESKNLYLGVSMRNFPEYRGAEPKANFIKAEDLEIINNRLKRLKEALSANGMAAPDTLNNDSALIRVLNRITQNVVDIMFSGNVLDVEFRSSGRLKIKE